MEKLIPFITIILLLICFFGLKVDAEDNDFFISGVDIVNTDVNITIEGDVTLDAYSILENNGEIELKNSQLAYLTLNSESNYQADSGFMRFTGSRDVIIAGTNPYLNNVSVDLSSGDIFCDKNLEIGGFLHLKNGIINLPDDEILQVHKSLPLAVSFHNENSFVQGRLQRNTLSGESYEFPVGSDNKYHLFEIKNATAEDKVDVFFDRDVYYDWSPYEKLYYSHVLNDGGWRVNANQNTEFKVGMSLENLEDPFINTSHLVVARMDQLNFPSGDWDYYTDATTNSAQWANLNRFTGSGIYTLAELLGLRYINLIVVGRGVDTHFIIEDVDKFIKRKIKIYNRWGQEIFESKTYNNEYDASGLPQGTYYFVFEYSDGDINGTESSFFEVKYED